MAQQFDKEIQMVNTNSFWYWDNVIPKEECDKIINLYPDKWVDAKVHTDRIERSRDFDRDIGHDINTRNSQVIFFSDKWVFELAYSFIKSANEQAGWEYDIESMENLQLTRYETEGFYGWHSDGPSDNFGKYDRPKDDLLNGLIRKLSITVLLNDDYEGGEFQFKFANEKMKGLDKVGHGLKTNTLTPPMKGTGSVIVFPSYQLHRVKPVTKGMRYSLVGWACGQPFK